MASVKKQLDSLLNQEMDRKHFLRYSGSILLAVLGITGLVRILLSSGGTTKPALFGEQPKSSGYGASKYGR